MMSWLQTCSAGFINLSTGIHLKVASTSPSGWRLVLSTGAGEIQLRGVYSTVEDALEAGRKLVHGIDPTTITGAEEPA